MLQFDVVAERLKTEYKVECSFEGINVATARWVVAESQAEMTKFSNANQDRLALDHAGDFVYLAPTQVNLQLAQERYPKVQFRATREQQ